MKTEHRHELKTNELAEWIANLPQWAKKNLTMIIVVSVVAVVATGLYLYLRYQKNVVSVRKKLRLTELITQLSQGKTQVLKAQAQGRDLSFILIRPADNLKILAEDTKDSQMAALALIKQAEALRTELHYRLEAASQQEIAAQIDRAEASYAEAFTKASGTTSRSGSPLLMAAAKFGVGLCEEERGNFASAENIYRYITENTQFQGTIAATQAKQRLETMADYQRKVVFNAPPKPTPAAPIQPRIQLSPADINLAETWLAGTSFADINLPSQ